MRARIRNPARGGCSRSSVVDGKFLLRAPCSARTFAGAGRFLGAGEVLALQERDRLFSSWHREVAGTGGETDRTMSSHNHNGHTAPPILLTIAGFDPSCGAGTAADLKTFAAHGCYGVAAITSITVQNTQGVVAVHNTPSAELREQLEALAGDCEIAAVKIGVLGNRGNAVAITDFLDA